MSDAGDIDVLLRRSLDGGTTWEPIQVIWDDGPNTCGNPCPVVDRSNGTIWLLLTHNLGVDREREIWAGTSQGTRTVWITKSTNEGETWSVPVEITEAAKAANWSWYATGPGVGIQLQRGRYKGRMVVPCDHGIAGLNDRFARNNIPARVVNTGSVFSIHFTSEDLVNYRSLARTDKVMAHRVFLALLEEGYFLSHGLTMNAISLPTEVRHVDGLIETIGHAVERAK